MTSKTLRVLLLSACGVMIVSLLVLGLIIGSRVAGNGRTTPEANNRTEPGTEHGSDHTPSGEAETASDPAPDMLIRIAAARLDDSREQAALSNALAGFADAYSAAHPGIGIEYVWYKAVPDKPDGEVDLVICTASDIQEYANRDQTVDLSGFIAECGIDVLPSALTLGQVRGNQVMVPFCYDRAVLYADKAVFDALGAPPNGKLDFGYSLEETAQGPAFAQQWERAVELRPAVVMLTGWNEFTFGKWATSKYPSQGIGQTVASMYKVTQFDPVWDSNYIDAMTAEYSRDIEPINGQFGDNYFMQMAEYIRLYKGVAPIPLSDAAFPVDMSGSLSEFDAAPALYFDTKGDTAHRDAGSVGSLYRYVNATGRNDLLEARVSKTADTVYFAIDCADDVIMDDGAGWMNLFINSDRSTETGWEGYDFIINRSRDGKTCTVERFPDADWDHAVVVGWAEYAVSGRRMVIAVPAALLGLNCRDSFDFMWADNSTVEGCVMQFMDLGDTAPNDRFRFRYVKSGGTFTDELLPAYAAENASETITDAPETDVGGSYTDTPPAARYTGVLRGTWIICLIADILLVCLLIAALILRRKARGSSHGPTNERK